MRLPFALAMSACAASVAAQGKCIGALEPAVRIAGEALADTDGDGTKELLLLARDGVLRRHRLGKGGSQSLPVDGLLRLRDPAHSLVSCRDLLPTAGAEVIVAEPGGTFVLAWPPGPEKDAPAPDLIARRARCTLRLGDPQWSPFVQDLNGDGLLDLLIPSLQGCQPFVQTRTADKAPEFQALAPLVLPVAIDAQRGGPSLDEDHQGTLVVPRVETADLNGDHRPDLITRQGKKHAFQLQGADGLFGAPIELDLNQFEDSTPKAAVAPGSTIVLGDDQHLARGDIDGDGIPDYSIAHRRKIWTFVSSQAGPQFTKARTQAVADDVSGMMLVDLDEDKRSDMLTFQVQLPSVGTLLLGLVQSIDIDVRAVGYRSAKDGFEPLPAWRRTVTIRIPSLLSLLSRQEEIVQRFLDIVEKARPVVRGAFTGPGHDDLAMASSDGKTLELYGMTSAPPELASAAGRRMLRTLLFEDPDTIFDLERMFGLLSGLIDQRTTRLTGNAKAAATAPLRDPEAWRLVRLYAANLDGAPGDEVVAVYEQMSDPEQRAYDVLTFEAAK